MSDHGNNISTQSEVKGQPFKLTVGFYYQGTVVPVSNPRVRLLSADSHQSVGFECVDSFPLMANRTEWELNPASTANMYEVTIDPLSLQIGLYKAIFQGEMTIGTTTVTQEIQGTIGLGELSRSDRIVSMALALMMDDPESYLFQEKVHQFKASNLFKFMEKAVQHINVQGSPATTYTIEDLPTNMDAIVVDYIVAMCLFAKARLAIENDVTINDSRSIQLDRHGKYMAMYSALMKEVNDKIAASKATQRPSPQGFRRHRFPYFFSRMISLLPQYRNVFNGYMV